MACDEVDPSLITSNRHKRKLLSYVTNEDNISADKDEVVKKMKHTMNWFWACEFSSILTIFLTKHFKATVEEIEDVDAHLRGNIPSKNPRHIIEPSDDEVAPPAASCKKAAGPSTSTNPNATGYQSLADKDSDMEEKDAHPLAWHNIYPKNPWHVPNLSDDDDSPSPWQPGHVLKSWRAKR